MKDNQPVNISPDKLPTHAQVVIIGGGALVKGLGTPSLESSTAHRQIKW
jgi:hypothetical protein